MAAGSLPASRGERFRARVSVFSTHGSERTVGAVAFVGGAGEVAASKERVGQLQPLVGHREESVHLAVPVAEFNAARVRVDVLR